MSETAPKRPQIKPTDSHRRAVHSLMRRGRSGCLAIASLAACCGRDASSPAAAPEHAPDSEAAPLTALVTFGSDGDRSPLFLFSSLSDHTQALRRDPRCSLLIEDASHLGNPQTGERVSLCGEMEEITDPQHAARARGRFVAQNPAAALYAGFGDFTPWRMRVGRAHYVGGFARAVWVPDGLLADPALVAEIAAMETDVLDHMNQDHADAISHFAAAFLELDLTQGAPWKMVSMDCDGMHLGHEGNARTHYLPFPQPLTAASECRATLVEMAKKARDMVTSMAFQRT